MGVRRKGVKYDDMRMAVSNDYYDVCCDYRHMWFEVPYEPV